MDPRDFDRLTRVIGSGQSRRRAVQTLAGGALGTLGLGRARGFASAHATPTPDDDASIALFEALAALVHVHVGTCDELAVKARAFQTAHGDELARHKAAQDDWPLAQQTAHADAYGDRRWDAAAKIHAARARCEFVIDPNGEHVATAAVSAGCTSDLHSGGRRMSVETVRLAAAAYVCDGSMTLNCSNPNTGGGFGAITVPALCDQNNFCQLCGISDGGSARCAAAFPQYCLGVTGIPLCVLDVPAPPSSCCQQNCPVGTADCTLSGLEALFGDYHCAACQLSWCGSTSSCLEHCGDEACCDSACNDGYVPPPPAGP